MNEGRRKRITKALKALAAAGEAIETAKEDIESCCGEEQEYYDNMPESIQNGSKGDQAQAAIGRMEELIENLDAISNYDLGNASDDYSDILE